MELIKHLVSVPIILIPLAIFLAFRFFIPKKINYWYGYRTELSMKNQKMWDFAQKYSSTISIRLMSMLLIVQIIFYYLIPNPAIAALTLCGLMVGACILIVVLTERKLKGLEGETKP